jgi:hypothetical protein
MRVLGLLLCGSACLLAQRLDKYGGSMDLQCSGGAANRFYTEKIGDRWWLCTPEGNAFWLKGVYAVAPGSTSVHPALDVSQNARALAKYGNNFVWGVETMRRMKSIGFNAPIDYSLTYAFHIFNPSMTEEDALPFTFFDAPARYGQFGEGNYHLRINPRRTAPGFKEFFRTIHPMVHGIGTAGAGQMGNAWSMIDVWDTMHEQYLEGLLRFGASGQAAAFSAANTGKRKWMMGITIDDGDWVTGTGASQGDEQHTFYPIVRNVPQPSKAQPHLVLDLLNASPYFNGAASTIFPAAPQIMSSQTIASGALVSMVNSGSALTVNFQAPHNLVVNDMVSITGAAAANDPDMNRVYYVRAVPSSTSIQLESVNVSDGAYTTPALALNRLRQKNILQYGDPRADTIDCYWQTGVNPTDSSFATAALPSNTLCAKYALRRFLETKYGSIDALISAWRLPQGYWSHWESTAAPHTNELVATADGSATVFTFAIPGIGGGTEITKHSLRVYTGGRFSAFDYCHQLPVGVVNRCTGALGYVYGAHLISEPASTANTSTVNYTTGAVTLRFRYPLPAGAEIRVDYTTGGWGTPQGTGFLDTWKLTPSSIWKLTGFSEQQKADMNEFLYWHARRYFLTNRRVLWKIDSPDNPQACATRGACVMYFGTTYLMGWGSPTHAKVLEAAQELVDVLPLATFPMGSSAEDDRNKTEYLYEHWGDRPMASWESVRSDEQPAGYDQTSAAEAYRTGTAAVVNGSTGVRLSGGVWTSAMTRRHFSVAGRNESYVFTYTSPTNGTLSRPYEGPTDPQASYAIWKPFLSNNGDHSRLDLPTQDLRGQKYTELISNYLNLAFPNGSHPMVGVRWWQWGDNYAESANWGLVNLYDDFYDGSISREKGVDLRGFAIGGWPLGGYSNFVKYVREGNSYWLNYLSRPDSDRRKRAK